MARPECSRRSFVKDMHGPWFAGSQCNSSQVWRKCVSQAAWMQQGPRFGTASLAHQVRWKRTLGPIKVKAVELHHFHPGVDEVLDKAVFRAVKGVDLDHRAQFGVGAIHKIRFGRGPFERA